MVYISVLFMKLIFYVMYIVVVLFTFCWFVGYCLVLCVAVLNVSCSWFCFYIRDGCVCWWLVFNSCNVLNIGLCCVSMFMSFMCKLFLVILWMWYFSNVFKYFHFFSVLMMSIVSVMVPYVCPVFNMWLEYPKLLLLFLIACLCSLYQM
jgi:hypothetical protein